jgi:hypothetical protein
MNRKQFIKEAEKTNRAVKNLRAAEDEGHALTRKHARELKKMSRKIDLARVIFEKRTARWGRIICSCDLDLLDPTEGKEQTRV